MPVRRKVFRIEEMNVARRADPPRERARAHDAAIGTDGLHARADEPSSGRVAPARSRASSDALCARTTEVPRWPLASLASAARVGETDAIYRAIARTRQEIAAFQAGGSGGMMNGRVQRELDAVVGGTEEATQRILTAAEEIDEAANSLSALVRQAQPQALAHDIRDQVIRIFEACNFQDLAGQRIAAVVTALQLVEAHVTRLTEIWGRIEAFRDAASAAAPERARKDVATNGPKLDGDVGHISQGEIDAMFGEERVANSE